MPTEAEAKALWCPFSRARMQGREGAANRYETSVGVPGACQCFASACMAWRWEDPKAVLTRRHVIPAEPEKPRRSHKIPLDEPKPRPENVPATWTWFSGRDWGEVTGSSFTQRIEPQWQEPQAEAKARFAVERVGYCGLAGKP